MNNDKIKKMNRELTSNIAKHGFTVMGVQSENDEPDFAYSIGLYQTYNHPEIMILGLELVPMQAIIKYTANQIKQGQRFQDGQKYQGLIPTGYDNFFRAVPLKWYDEYFGTAIRFYGHYNFPVLQFVYPDKEGWFPWEVECEPAMKDWQLILADMQTDSFSKN